MSHIFEIVGAGYRQKFAFCLNFVSPYYTDAAQVREHGLDRRQKSFQCENAKETELAYFCDLYSKMGRVCWRGRREVEK